MNGTNYYRRNTCRACGSTRLLPVLDLGTMPPANAFLRKEDFAREEVFPLSVVFCDECTLLQVPDVVSPDTLFGGYVYLTSASAPLARHFEDLARMLVERYTLSTDDLLLEVGSNDGSLLAAVKDRVRVLGIDPAEGAAALAREKGVPTLVSFLDDAVVEQVLAEHGSARIITANNVMAHIDDIVGTFARVKRLLAPGGTFVFEVHWVGNLLGEGGFDQIYHEHLCYYSLRSARAAIERAGLLLADAELVPVHGQSLRMYAVNGGVSLSTRAQALLAEEERRGLGTYETYSALLRQAEAVRHDLTDALARLKREGARVVGYGAPAKGNTLLNYCRIDAEHLAYIADSTPSKQGLYTPGTHIPIVTPDVFHEDEPRAVLLLAWNYADTILANERAVCDRGGMFIIPMPRVRFVQDI